LTSFTGSELCPWLFYLEAGIFLSCGAILGTSLYNYRKLRLRHIGASYFETGRLRKKIIRTFILCQELFKKNTSN
jgi:hypothetical protein